MADPLTFYGDALTRCFQWADGGASAPVASLAATFRPDLLGVPVGAPLPVEINALAVAVAALTDFGSSAKTLVGHSSRTVYVRGSLAPQW